MLSAYVQGVGIVGPGIADWPSAVQLFQGVRPYLSAPTVLAAPSALPAAERRRAGRVIRLALGVGAEAVTDAGADAHALPSVFSSSGGDGDNCHEICSALASNEPLISPTRFHNSVHNASSGYWSIAYGCPEPSTALCAHDASFGAGLLESLAQLERSRAALLLVTYDVDYPPPMRRERPIPDAFGVGLLLSYGGNGSAAAPARRPHAHLRVSFTDAPATVMPQPELESLRRQIPAARALPLLAHLALRREGAVVLDFLDPRRLRVEVGT